ncbi:MAG: 30S ribosomal protein S20 [Candidatus Omnitrophica bacterium]|nr:30S ribosomal protein S20 [Candidatus Omnitrophota bacterium]
MPKRRSAVKRLRADAKRRLRNIRIKRILKTTIKKFKTLVSNKNIDEAKELLKKIYSQLDKAAKKKVIHTRTAQRKKSRLTLQLMKAALKTTGAPA